MKIIECVQLSPEWWQARRGIPTASEFDKIITPAKGQLSASAGGYAAQLVAETFCLDPNAMTETPMNAAMRHGVNCEPEARKWYAQERDVDVRMVGFCLTDDGRWGCSPDGLVGEDGCLELKCPQGKMHIEYLLDGVLPAAYKPQVHGQMLVTGRKWCDFLSYCAGLPPLLVRVERDEFTVKLAAALEGFSTLYQKILDEVVKKGGAS